MALEPLTAVLVDDAPEVRSLVRMRLRLSGEFTVVGEGANGVDAIALASEHRPSLMLMDVSMPTMDGLEALPEVLKASPTTHVIMLSGFAEEGLSARARQLGALAFIEKSAVIDGLVDEVLQLLHSQGEGTPPPAAPRDAPGPEGLHEDVERFKEMFEHAAIGMATLTLSGQIVRANRELASLIGRPPSDLIGTPYAAYAAEGTAAEVQRRLTELNQGLTELVQVEHDTLTPTPRRLSATIAAVRAEKGRPLYFFLQARDVTDERELEDRLRRSEERFRLLVEGVDDTAIFMLDPDGRIASWNTGAQHIKGYTAEEIVGQHFRVFYPPQEQQAHQPERELTTALEHGRWEGQGPRIRKDGTTFHAKVVITPLYDPPGHHIGFSKVTRNLPAPD